MKLVSLLMLSFLINSSLSAQTKPVRKDVVIKGKIQFLNPEPYTRFNKVFIYTMNGADKVMVDSTPIKPNGEWQLKLKNVLPAFYKVDIASWDRATIFSDGNIIIDSRGYDTAKMKIKNPPYVFVEGSDANNFINLADHLVYMNYQQTIAAGKEMYYASKDADTTWSAYLKGKNPYDALNTEFIDRIKVLIRAYRDKPEVVYALGMINWEKNQDLILPILKNLNKKYPWFKDANEFRTDMENRIAQAKLLKSGKPIPAVSYPDDKGSLKGFEQYKGKVLLVDFWASWCGPCRQAVPKVKELYSKYQDKGFDVVSISIDDSKTAWRKAMSEENMPWQQWLSPDKNKTMSTFLFSGIPTLYLIDRNGNILRSFTGFTDDLPKIVEQQFDKKS
ncbi:MAG: TlpA family protein disulfide reductase [Bacteroidetes bacterium]|nr:TlpA family protein disulfide reductase [Bacteroidota bacterium]